MERLVSTSEAAQILGLSLQGVHYRIKNGQLKSLKQGGKTFVYVTEFFQNQNKNEQESKQSQQETNKEFFNESIKQIILGKDEQISLLKESINFIKDQYQNEVKRLEKNQKRVIRVFNSEIELLQSAFNEMRSIYKPKIQAPKPQQNGKKFISMNDFFLFLKQENKSDDEIKILILNAIKQKDSRFIYNKKSKKVLILNEDYSDLI